ADDDLRLLFVLHVQVQPRHLAQPVAEALEELDVTDAPRVDAVDLLREDPGLPLDALAGQAVPDGRQLGPLHEQQDDADHERNQQAAKNRVAIVRAPGGRAFPAQLARTGIGGCAHRRLRRRTISAAPATARSATPSGLGVTTCPSAQAQPPPPPPWPPDPPDPPLPPVPAMHIGSDWLGRPNIFANVGQAG